MQAKFLVIFSALVAVATASTGGCPHPEEAKTLVFQKIVLADAPNDGRHVEHIEIPREILTRTDFSCITVVANRAGATPDYISLSKNKQGGYSVIVHSAIRNPLNSTVYVYTQ